MTEQNNAVPQCYFPFTASANFKADYLHLVMQQGAEAARVYEAMSYGLLKLGEGLQVPDVGCGVGIDLAHLADRVGRQGQVVGLELDATWGGLHNRLLPRALTLRGRWCKETPSECLLPARNSTASARIEPRNTCSIQNEHWRKCGESYG